VKGLAAPSSLPRRTDPGWEDELARILAGSASLPAAAKQAVCEVLESIMREGSDDGWADSARSVIAALQTRPPDENRYAPSGGRGGFVPLSAL